MIDPADIDLTALLSQWYGPPARDEVPLPDSCAWLPEPLRRWHRAVRRWEVRVLADHRMPAPEDMRPGADGTAVFMTDHTGDWHWAFSVDEPDGVVNGEPGGPWHANPERLAAFLGHMILKQIFFTGPVRMRAISVPDGPVAEIVAGLEPFDVSSWMWGEPDDRILRGEDLLVEAFRTGPGPGWYVQVAATRTQTLNRLKGIAGVDWW
ncbi:hypothetical protein [Streptomyces sp. NPDC096132]|uniref:hypothetical protein n=1 Tax=Streptomyces sp. NPDC096132 TaxID=3366075 RepID=UPI003822B3A3